MKLKTLVGAALPAAIFLTSTFASAAERVWNGGTAAGGAWSDAKWDGNGTWNHGADPYDTAVFGGVINDETDRTITIASGATINVSAIKITRTGTGGNITVGLGYVIGSGGTLHFGATQGLIDTTAAGAKTRDTIAANLTGDYGLKIASHGDPTQGFITLSGDNGGLTGGITVASGGVNFKSQNAAGNNAIFFGNGTSLNSDAGGTLNNSIQMTGVVEVSVWNGKSLTLSDSVTGDSNTVLRTVSAGALNLTGNATNFKGAIVGNSGSVHIGTRNARSTETAYTFDSLTAAGGSIEFWTGTQAVTYNIREIHALSSAGVGFHGATNAKESRVNVETVTVAGTSTSSTGLYVDYAVLNVISGDVNMRTNGRLLGTEGYVTSESGTLNFRGMNAADELIENTGTNNFDAGLRTVNLVIKDYGSGDHPALKVVKDGYTTTAFEKANTYSGGTEIKSGRLDAKNVKAFGSGEVVVKDGGQALFLTEGTYENKFKIAGNGGKESGGSWGALYFGVNADGKTVTLSGAITLDGNASISAYSTKTVVNEITGDIDVGSHTLEFRNSGKISLEGNVSGSASGPGGKVTINAVSGTNFGTILLGKENVFKNIEMLTVSNGTLNLQTYNQSVEGLTLSGGTIAGTGTLSAATGEITAGTLNANLAISEKFTVKTVGAMAGTGTVTVAGNAELVLATGATLAGSRILIDGTGTDYSTINTEGTGKITGGLTVAAGKSFQGSFTVDGNLSAAGTNLKIGNSPGLITVNGAVDLSDAKIAVGIEGVTFAEYDRLVATGIIDLTDVTLDLSITDGVLAYGETRDFILFEGSSITGWDAVGYDLDPNQYTAMWSNPGVLTITAVPEPSTYALMAGLAGVGLALVARRRRKG